MIRQLARSIPFVYKTYGYLQYLYYEYLLNKSTKHDLENHLDQDGIPYPPAKLRWRVHGAFDLQSFIDVGLRDCTDIVDLLSRIDKKVSDFNSILDFGCGCGRVIRYLRKHTNFSRICGTDIDNEAVIWCQKNLLPLTFYNNPFEPPSSFSDARFDFIYAISVFTHLDEDMQLAWLNELKRITKVGGIILLTVHGPSCYGKFTNAESNVLKTKGFLFHVSQTGRFKMDGLPDFYQTTYHSREYIYREWGKIFTVLDYIDQGVNGHQDAILLLKE